MTMRQEINSKLKKNLSVVFRKGIIKRVIKGDHTGGCDKRRVPVSDQGYKHSVLYTKYITNDFVMFSSIFPLYNSK